MASIVNTKGVDISYCNGDVDLLKVKNAGYKWVMIRCGWGNNSTDNDDSRFAANVAKAEKLGMPWGVYLFSYACSTSDAKSELAHIDRLLKAQKAKGYLPTLPIAIDIEPTDTVKNKGGWTSSNLTNVATIVLDGLKNLGYYPIIYTGYEELAMMNNHIRNNYDCWFAQWNSTPNAYKYNRMGIWQYGGETNYIDGNSISGVGVIDKNKCYKDYPTIIKNSGYNGFKKPSGSSSSSSSNSSTGNSAVKTVQTWINNNYKTGLVVDGVYGKLTKAALVKALQTELNKQCGAGLVVDGVFGNLTASTCINLSVGSQGNITKVLQGLLICNGYSTNGFDGVFGNGTRNAVIAYQKSKGLTADGVAGRYTFTKLCQ